MHRAALIRFAIAGTIMIGAMTALSLFGTPVPALIALFLASVPLGIWAARPLPALAFPALFFVAGICVFGIWLVDTPPVGAIVEGEPRPFASAPFVAAYRGSDWRIARDFAEESKIHARKGAVGVRTVAPVNAPSWSPLQPANVWVVGYAFNSGKIGPRHPQHWQAPGELVRLVGADMPAALAAIETTAAKRGLFVGEEIAAFTWRPSAAIDMRDQAFALAKLFGIFFALFAAAVALHKRFGDRAVRPLHMRHSIVVGGRR